jgi:sarcosine oxidase subunit alpha
VPGIAQQLSGGAAAVPGKVLALDRDALACVLGEQHLLVLSASMARTDATDPLARFGELAAEHLDVTSAYAGVHIIGPNGDALLRRLTALDVSHRAFPHGSCAETSCAGIHATFVRDPERSLPAVRVYVSWDFGEYLWRSLLDAGHSLGVVPIGIDAWRELCGTVNE